MGLAENDEMIQALELTLARPQHNHARLLRLKPERRHSGPVRRLNIHISACSMATPASAQFASHPRLRAAAMSRAAEGSDRSRARGVVA